VVPGEKEPPKWVREFYACQQCGWKRQRKDVFVIANDKDEYKVVGRTCLKDFFGGLSPDALINWAKMIDAILETRNDSKNYLGAGRVKASVLTYPLEAVLMYTHAEIAVHGWVSATEAWNNNTAGTKIFVRGYIDNDVYAQKRRKTLYKEAQAKGVTLFTDESKDEVRKAIQWARDLKGVKTYEHNIKTLAENGYATWRDIGMACSILPSYRRAESRRHKYSRTPSIYLGIVGEKVEFDATVVFMKEFQTQFGWSCLVKFVTDNGNVVNWWSSVTPSCTKNDKVTVKGKVKKHDEYKGIKQTTITYAKVTVK